MTNASQQARALEQTAGARFVDNLKVFLLSGDDQRSWLNGQVTNDVRNTRPGEAVYCLAVTVKGRIMADVWALDLGEQLALAIPGAAAEEVLASFDSQIIMEDVEIEPSELRILSIQGPKAEDVVNALPGDITARRCAAAELGESGYFLLLEPSELARAKAALGPVLAQVDGAPIDDPGFELARIRARRPRFGLDFGMSTYPQEAGLKERAVSFNKGCYLGQEVVCTLESRGRLARTLCALSATDELTADMPLTTEAGDEIGRVTSVALDGDQQTWLALGFVKRAHATADTVLRCDAGSVRVLAPLA